MNPFAESVLKELQRAIAAQQGYIAGLQREDQEDQFRKDYNSEREATLKEAAQALTSLIEGYVTMTCNAPEKPNV